MKDEKFSADTATRFKDYASQLLELSIQDFQMGGISLPTEDEDSEESGSVSINSFELFAIIQKEPGFFPDSEFPRFESLFKQIHQLYVDAKGWFYVPLGESNLEFVSTSEWLSIYREWLLWRRLRNGSSAKPHNEN